MIQLALSDEEKRQRQMPLARPAINAPQMMQQEKGPLGQMTDMAQQKLMTSAVDKGAEALTAKATEAMAGNAALQGIGTAMPYVGMGLMAGKALGFFNQGGPVNQEMLGPLAIRKLKYKQDGGKIEVEISGG
jgi:hypothetical protein